MEKLSVKQFQKKKLRYDYKNQAWVIDGVYSSCNHPESMNCHCYGKLHAGEQAPKDLQ